MFSNIFGSMFFIISIEAFIISGFCIIAAASGLLIISAMLPILLMFAGAETLRAGGPASVLPLLAAVGGIAVLLLGASTLADDGPKPPAGAAFIMAAIISGSMLPIMFDIIFADSTLHPICRAKQIGGG